MNTFKRFLSLFALLALAGSLFAQTKLSITTLSAAISGPDPSSSVFGLVGGSTNSLNVTLVLAACNQTDMTNFNRVSSPVKLFIDFEAFDVQSFNATTCATQVLRGTDGTTAAPHVSGATVYIGTPDKFGNFDIPAGTACTAGTGQDLYTPRINLSTGTTEDCLNGRWVVQSTNRPGFGDPEVTYDQPYTQWTTFSTPNEPAFNNATDVNGQIWFSQLLVGANSTLTGACWTNGSGTLADKVIVILWDKAGNVLANSATAGVTQSGTSQLQCAAFTATVNVVGPQTYFIGIQGNGTTAGSFALYPAGGAPTKYGTGTQSGTFGTVAAITPTTTFTANKGPIMSTY